MTKTEQIYRICIVAARSLAVPIAFFGFLSLSEAGDGVPDWRHVFSWETVWLITFFGYAVFIILPIDRLSSALFWAIVTVGTILAAGSIYMSLALYEVLIGELLEGKLLFCIMAWILIVPVYLYIPILILKRRHYTANKVLQRMHHSSEAD